MPYHVGDFVNVNASQFRNGAWSRGTDVNAIVVEVVSNSNRPPMYRCVYDNGTERYGTELTAGVYDAVDIDDNQKNTLLRFKNLYEQNNEGRGGKKKKSRKSRKSSKSRKSRKSRK